MKMRNNSKKAAERAILIISLFTMLLITPLSGCKKKEPEPEPIQMTDEEAKEIMKSLIPESEKINEIFWGKGLEAEERKDGGASVIFLPVKDGCGYGSIADIKAAAEKVYSKSYLTHSVYTGMFDGIASESADGVVDFAMDPRYKDIGGRLYVNVSYTPLELKTKLITDTARVEASDAYSVTIRMNYEISGEGSGALDVKIVMQDGEWRLDTPSY